MDLVASVQCLCAYYNGTQACPRGPVIPRWIRRCRFSYGWRLLNGPRSRPVSPLLRPPPAKNELADPTTGPIMSVPPSMMAGTHSSRKRGNRLYQAVACSNLATRGRGASPGSAHRLPGRWRSFSETEPTANGELLVARRGPRHREHKAFYSIRVIAHGNAAIAQSRVPLIACASCPRRTGGRIPGRSGPASRAPCA